VDYERAKSLLRQAGQSHLLDYYGELDEKQRNILLKDIEKIDFTVLENIGLKRATSVGELSPVQAETSENISANREKYEKAGLEVLKAGKVGAVLLAGGQGTRLGFDKPKGMYDIGVTRHLYIFQLLMESVKNAACLSGVNFPLFIMTGEKNDAQTRAFFKENGFFGYPEDRIYFFVQDTEPACSYDGKIFLDEKYRLSLSPNGNGGWYESLVGSGASAVLEREGIEWLNVFGVDNVLQRICDPVFIGATCLSGCESGAKVVKKTCAEEKVGVLCKVDGKPSIIEYYDMPHKDAALCGADGGLVYRYGVILNYLFKVEKLNGTLGKKLPYHLAEKAIPHIENGVRVLPTQPNGYKFEKLVVDMISLTGDCLAFEVERNREFAPVKNKTGVDSVETARALLNENGVQV